MDLSPGLAQSAFELLGLIGRQRLTVDAVNSGLQRIAGMPAEDVLALTQALNWIEIGSDGLLAATRGGVHLLDQDGYAEMLRIALIDHATILSPPWVQNARMGRSRTLAFAPVGVRQVFVEAEVAEGTSTDIVAFWDQLAAHARGQRDERLTAIGRLGERLSIEREVTRTGHTPRWVAIESNADGYDVLSSVASDDRTPLAIEVKTTTMGITGQMILTRHEWETANNSAAHRFHLWDVSRGSSPRLAEVGLESMLLHIPADQGDGRWLDIAVPFAAFEDLFTG